MTTAATSDPSQWELVVVWKSVMISDNRKR